MKKYTLLYLTIVFNITIAFSQVNINEYAFVVIPEQFSFQKTPNQYQVNELLKFLFEKEGMTTFLDNEKIPKELMMLDCGGLKLKLNNESSMFKTKLSFTLSDCVNEVVFTSEQGVSREKDYKKGYQEGVRNAFKSFSEIDYAYVPVAGVSVTAAVLDKENTTATNKQTYTNDVNLSIELVVSDNGFIGNVVESPTEEYSPGDMICQLIKTSLPNIFKVQWKDAQTEFINTTGYFDEKGNLKIDFSGDNGVTVMTFFVK